MTDYYCPVKTHSTAATTDEIKAQTGKSRSAA
jgi:hypothetical protein